MKIIYISGPFSNGDTILNIRKVCEVAEKIKEMGFLPYIPHLNLLWHMMFPKDYEYWLSMDEIWVVKCDGLYRVPGESLGADREVRVARQNNIPIFYNFNDIKRYFYGNGKKKRKQSRKTNSETSQGGRSQSEESSTIGCSGGIQGRYYSGPWHGGKLNR